MGRRTLLIDRDEGHLCQMGIGAIPIVGVGAQDDAFIDHPLRQLKCAIPYQMTRLRPCLTEASDDRLRLGEQAEMGT